MNDILYIDNIDFLINNNGMWYAIAEQYLKYSIDKEELAAILAKRPDIKILTA